MMLHKGLMSYSPEASAPQANIIVLGNLANSITKFENEKIAFLHPFNNCYCYIRANGCTAFGVFKASAHLVASGVVRGATDGKGEISSEIHKKESNLKLFGLWQLSAPQALNLNRVEKIPSQEARILIFLNFHFLRKNSTICFSRLLIELEQDRV